MSLKDASMEWHRAAHSYLARLSAEEYAQQLAYLKKRTGGGVPKFHQWQSSDGHATGTFRHTPSQYCQDLVNLLGKNDENGFKALKMLSGYASVIGV